MVTRTIIITSELARRLIELCDDLVGYAWHEPDQLADQLESAMRDADLAEAIRASERWGYCKSHGECMARAESCGVCTEVSREVP